MTRRKKLHRPGQSTKSERALLAKTRAEIDALPPLHKQPIALFYIPAFTAMTIGCLHPVFLIIEALLYYTPVWFGYPILGLLTYGAIRLTTNLWKRSRYA